MWSSLCFCSVASKDFFRSSARLNSCSSAPDLVNTCTHRETRNTGKMATRTQTAGQAARSNVTNRNHAVSQQESVWNNLNNPGFQNHMVKHWCRDIDVWQQSHCRYLHQYLTQLAHRDRGRRSPNSQNKRWLSSLCPQSYIFLQTRRRYKYTHIKQCSQSTEARLK